MVINTNIDKKEVKAMITVFRILFGKNEKVGNRLAYKGSSLSFFKPNNHPNTVIGAFSLRQINSNSMT
ncbi:hypothetical protein CN680_13830 [Bacillus pseudomycoides]|uniref:hypothetical protein n=1 Tax=Bacillus pseudomycoides TaxID=64104 RepID=UPI000BED9284|nr:hypothetical protein [Bacillus pseudomycoides]PED69045.1 hypothetical protein CON97_27555 [Bacillus pseudomycoides]PEI37449.1 hypothetical protein CN620_22430 [Bacillus pseudomycoides]PEJ78118.1 hypothetical protein CN680_13830 [Bacillus pseudomycoides]PEM07721.1 hypothetical protein CN628_25395 [Bacillus pseudomycoides]PEO90101.1 hypothetical protein CN550_28495 [Bacillus pseudomycoides]